ncbi:hypothetical protein [Phormidium sp. FACHB-1136]|jgi:IS5 family transposase|uniref:hypothetical protein n=1 Tax=Phormidium sp. FACHB-1136 TaxID=2692848 RepID=UPI001681C855|nr:hypothetical protein [Phormidium sp. FACHB-1136]MBD2428005.1 hypothetical protein [Phormidium sp. FACHB-1136]
MGQKGFWDFEERQQELLNKNKTLKYLNDIIPWELFRYELESLHKKDRKSNAGRKPIDVILGLKNLTYNFMRFIFWETREPVLN